MLTGSGTAAGRTAFAFADTGLSVPVLALVLLAWCVVPTLLAGRLVRRRSI